MCEMPVILGRAGGLSGSCAVAVSVKATREAVTMSLNCMLHLEYVLAPR
jgi:hypothetical protein